MDPKQLEFNQMLAREMPKYLNGPSFANRTLVDTPTDALASVNRRYVTANGSVAGRPSSSVAVVGQFFLNTQNNTPMWYTNAGWVNGVGSVCALP